MVTYYPDERLNAHVAAALCHAQALLIVDNTPGLPTPVLLEAALIPEVSVERFGVNRGVGAALNRGVRAAKERGSAWLLTLDQDTSLSPHWAEAVGSGALPGSTDFAVIGVGFGGGLGESGTHGGEPNVWEEQGLREVNRVITSGSLWSMSALTQLGEFREDFVVDGIDNEMCFRARARGYHVLVNDCIAMHHEMGGARPASWLGRPFMASTYGPVRYYYIFRNFVEIARQYGARERGWLREEVDWLYWLIKSALATRSGAHLRALAWGVAHGVARRFGPAPPFLQG